MKFRYLLGIYFDTSPEFWLNLQAKYDLECVNDLKFKSIEKQIANKAVCYENSVNEFGLKFEKGVSAKDLASVFQIANDRLSKKIIK